VRLDRASSGSSFASLSGREGLFILPPGALSGSLSPVCVGVYPSEAAARRAIGATAPFPGSASRPIAKPIRSLVTRG
jgi:hypothetical protein